MELIDILTSDGTPTGQRATRTEVHTKGLWHRTVHVWFVNARGEILLQKRSDTKESHPGEYDISAAGHIDAGETSVEAALREVKEELGVILIADELIKIGEFKRDGSLNGRTYIVKHINDSYVARKDVAVEDFVVQASEVSLVRYISVAELKEWIRTGKRDLVMHDEEFVKLFEYLGQ